MVENHNHSGTDSQKLFAGVSLENAPQDDFGQASGTADSTYSSNEQTMLNDLVTKVNEIRTVLRNLGLMK